MLPQRFQVTTIEDLERWKNEPVEHTELKVTFYPSLHLQRRMWILDKLRTESVTEVLDVGCGEGQILSVLCQPAPWLAPPPLDILPPTPIETEHCGLSSTYTDQIPNLHPVRLFGLDVSVPDLAFAVEAITPPKPEVEHDQGSDDYRPSFSNVGLRWEDLDARVWRGGLEVINEEFVSIECIISTEVIEHLTPEVFPAFAPVLLGVYHPRLLLVTTPSYTFNARFTAPDAPPSARQGFLDPTKRTDRIFRHDDHKFEWTVQEFQAWCEKTAQEWGYTVRTETVGYANEVDDWGRDEELGGATSVAMFRRIEDGRDLNVQSVRARALLQQLRLGDGQQHELLAAYRHLANKAATNPVSLKEIGAAAKAKMEEFREAFVRLEELWFEKEIAVACGGWMELLIRAVEEHPDLVLKREGDGAKGSRATWTVEVVGGVSNPRTNWSDNAEANVDDIPEDWMPGECGSEDSEEDNEWTSTAMDGDVSWNNSDADDEDDEGTTAHVWGTAQKLGQEQKKGVAGTWGDDSLWGTMGVEGGVTPIAVQRSPNSSSAGWDGDESDDTTS